MRKPIFIILGVALSVFSGDRNIHCAGITQQSRIPVHPKTALSTPKQLLENATNINLGVNGVELVATLSPNTPYIYDEGSKGMAKRTRVWSLQSDFYNVHLTNLNLQVSSTGNLIAIGRARSKNDPVIYTCFVTTKDWVGVEYYALEYLFTSAIGGGVLELRPSEDAPCALSDTAIGRVSYFSSTSHDFKLISDPIRVERTPANKNKYGEYHFCVTYDKDYKGCLWEPGSAGNHIVLSKINLYHYIKKAAR